ncbi:casein kinase II subunit beta-1 [Ilyonectria robusta]
MASDLSVIESSAEMLYGLIHQRFICSRAGIQQMSEKYELGHFGCCPRTNCEQSRTLPVGLSDIPGEDTVKLFCPSCLDVYVPPNSRFQTVDGAFFGRTFGALFLLTFPEYDLSKRGIEVLTNNNTRVSDLEGLVNGMYAKNIAPGLGPGRIYEPRIYGFRVSERARSGPRMQWLRGRPTNISELDEARLYAEQNPEGSSRMGIRPWRRVYSAMLVDQAKTQGEDLGHIMRTASLDWISHSNISIICGTAVSLPQSYCKDHRCGCISLQSPSTCISCTNGRRSTCHEIVSKNYQPRDVYSSINQMTSTKYTVMPHSSTPCIYHPNAQKQFANSHHSLLGGK